MKVIIRLILALFFIILVIIGAVITICIIVIKWFIEQFYWAVYYTFHPHEGYEEYLFF